MDEDESLAETMELLRTDFDKMCIMFKESALKSPAIVELNSDDIETEEEEEENSDVKKRLSIFDKHTRVIPHQFLKRIEYMGETSWFHLVFEKKLSSSDVRLHRKRFIFPATVIGEEFLSKPDEERLKTVGMEVQILEPDASLSTLIMSKRKINGVLRYQFTGEWGDLVARHSLEKGLKFCLWSFLLQSQLCFALVVADRPIKEVKDDKDEAGTSYTAQY